MTIKVYCNPGENANRPWHVGLHDGFCIVDHFAAFRNPIDAINFALDGIDLELPVIWPDSVILN